MAVSRQDKRVERKAAVEECARQVAVKAEERAIGFAWIVLLPLLLPLIEKLLEMCFHKDPAKLAAKIAKAKSEKKSNTLRRRLLNTIRSHFPSYTPEQHTILAECMIEVAEQTPPATMQAMDPDLVAVVDW